MAEKEVKKGYTGFSNELVNDPIIKNSKASFYPRPGGMTEICHAKNQIGLRETVEVRPV